MGPFIPAAVAFALGIWTGRLYAAAGRGLIIASGAAVLLLALVWWKFRFCRPVYVLVFLVCFAAGVAAFVGASGNVQGNLASSAGQQVTLQGTVSGNSIAEEDRTVFNLSVDGEIRGVIRVYLYGDRQPILLPGDQLQISGSLELPRPRRNPGGFDYALHLLANGAGAALYTYIPPLVQAQGTGFFADLSKLRLDLSQSISRFLPAQEGRVLNSIIFGRLGGIDDDIGENFRKAGMAHLLAVSGLHVGLAAAFILGLLSWAGVPRFRAAAAAVPFILIYALLAGASPSALRAALMLSLSLAAVAIDRINAVGNAVAIAALITLVWQPLQLFNPGFHLSYSAVASILFFIPRLYAIRRFLPRKPADLIAVTAAAQLGVLPFTAYHFGIINVIALVSNLVIIPLIGLIIAIGLAAGLSGLIAPALSWIALADLPLLSFIRWWAALLAKIPAGYLEVAPVPQWLLLYLPLYLVPLWWSYEGKRILGTGRRDNRLVRITAVFLLTAVIWVGSDLLMQWHSRDILSVAFLDVGQGDAIHISTPEGHNILVDTGGSSSGEEQSIAVGMNTLLPYLRTKGVSRVDLAVITHPHADHFGGLPPVLDAYDVMKIAVNGGSGNQFYQDVLALAENREIPFCRLQAGEIISLGDELSMAVYNADREDWTDNDDSLVMCLQYKQTNMLLTGDIEGKAIAALTEQGIPPSEILKIPHHGAFTDEIPDFIEAVAPKAAVISVGRNNYGHPDPKIISLLAEAGIIIFRTDENGAVLFTSDGDRWEVVPYIK